MQNWQKSCGGGAGCAAATSAGGWAASWAAGGWAAGWAAGTRHPEVHAVASSVVHFDKHAPSLPHAPASVPACILSGCRRARDVLTRAKPTALLRVTARSFVPAAARKIRVHRARKRRWRAHPVSGAVLLRDAPDVVVGAVARRTGYGCLFTHITCRNKGRIEYVCDRMVAVCAYHASVGTDAGDHLLQRLLRRALQRRIVLVACRLLARKLEIIGAYGLKDLVIP